MDDLRFNAVEMDNDADTETEQHEEVIDKINYRTPFQSRSARMVTRSTFPTRTAFQEPTVEVYEPKLLEVSPTPYETTWQLRNRS